MTFDFLALAAHGLIALPWWGYVVVALVAHARHDRLRSRSSCTARQAHRALDLHPAVSHFFRFWLWLTTGMVTKEWVAIHRKHHAKVETDGRPAQPADARHRDGASGRAPSSIAPNRENAETLDKYGHGTPDDWIERNVYTRSRWQGVGLMLVVNLMLFGAARR